ncbi:AAA family ATPase [Neorhizobium galegae]|uniref:AAA family ATPase n=1 Tax=Neorhizobium galegae TaxID=399 RepID=UPI0021046CD9|nr:AAA family ATPase [Neorhizobium galegae]MCQ1779403.1 AAA family ATPase [Neorhizobium galegae]MCQ1795563.1 AAA family ATPase [Neorhizobium galegae]
MFKKRTPLKRAKDFALYVTMKRALKGNAKFALGGAGHILLLAPEGTMPGEYSTAAFHALHPDEDILNADYGYMLLDDTMREGKILTEFESECGNKDRSIIVAAVNAVIPGGIRLAVDSILDIEPIGPRALRIAARVVLKMRVTETEAAQLLTYPKEHMWIALRSGRKLDDILRRMAALQREESRADHPKASQATPSLSEMHGYGKAKDWGLQLARDLYDWSVGTIPWDDVDKGLILSGPPGVGKTVFAKALAAECGVELVAGSLGQWQATGHLGDTLKAMRATFAKAKKAAPAILFIDEIDSFGDRSKFAPDNKDYSTQVVNAFLEQIDGVEGREGVVMVGATNNLENIDPAILRSGRLDQIIEVEMPNGADRVAILAAHLKSEFAASDLEGLKAATQEMSGADLAKAAREARRIARLAKRPVTIEDVNASLPTMVKIEGEMRRYIALHESGHTLVGNRLRHGIYIGTQIIDAISAQNTSARGGAAYFDMPLIARRDRQYYCDQIAVMLAGIAAEEIAYGAFADGGASDLAAATRVATLMEARYGMGATLTYSAAAEDAELERLRQFDRNLAERVHHTLQGEFERAKAILMEQRWLLDEVAAELVTVGSLTPTRLQELRSKEATLPVRSSVRGKRASAKAG